MIRVFHMSFSEPRALSLQDHHDEHDEEGDNYDDDDNSLLAYYQHHHHRHLQPKDSMSV